MHTIYVYNDSENYGGSEVYAHFFAQALVRRGIQVELLISPDASFWERLDLTGITVRPVRTVEDVERLVPADALLVCHNGPSLEWLQRLAKRGNVVGMAHNPPTPAHRHEYYAPANLLFAVSNYVISCCHRYGYMQTYPQPLFGVGEITRGISNEPIIEHERYVFETRKARDWLLSRLYPVYMRYRPQRIFQRKPALTIGIVSRIAQIKQFHLLLQPIAPILARCPDVNIEVFGSGKYSLVHAVERALRPLGSRVRYWGWQWDVTSIYPQLDYLLAGLPEREALGLNVIEAQFCGTPVLAVNEPPFTETIAEGRTGFLFRDPRQDAGADFERVLRHIRDRSNRPDPRVAADHLAQFTFDAFATRVQLAVEYAYRELVLRRLPEST